MKRFCIIMLSVTLLFLMCSCAKIHDDEPVDPQEGADVGSQLGYGTVRVLEEISDTQESSYRIGAELPGTDFSTIGQTLANKIEQEWNEYDSKSAEQILLSSHVWGTVYLKTDTWAECEEAIGFRVNNPLEDFDWLNKTGYFGTESVEPNYPVAHVHVTAYAPRELSRLDVTAGYNTEKVKASLTATLCATDGTYTMGNVYKGYVTYEQNNMTTGSGIPVLIVITDVANNTGYYNDKVFTSIAYWVKDNVFYTLHVSGEETERDEIQTTLERILAGI